MMKILPTFLKMNGNQLYMITLEQLVLENHLVCKVETS